MSYVMTLASRSRIRGIWKQRGRLVEKPNRCGTKNTVFRSDGLVLERSEYDDGGNYPLQVSQDWSYEVGRSRLFCRMPRRDRRHDLKLKPEPGNRGREERSGLLLWKQDAKEAVVQVGQWFAQVLIVQGESRVDLL